MISCSCCTAQTCPLAESPTCVRPASPRKPLNENRPIVMRFGSMKGSENRAQRPQLACGKTVRDGPIATEMSDNEKGGDDGNSFHSVLIKAPSNNRIDM